ncbi:hypothetical protein HPB49_011230 [Dermacentor silvarum]|uniref:Uncharacterized protein n=1 Tax=Dermacentor silvarum TaxID=543639 RepID=A0ACB8C3J5_DERSI|nr:hypothetical protein HPB49_011230 [Dermacentor silvarum]
MGVDPDVPASQLIEAINSGNPGLALPRDSCTIRTSYRERGGNMTHVFEIDPASFRRILSRPRLMVGWTVVRAVEDLHVSVCTYCSTYGHARCACPDKDDPSKDIVMSSRPLLWPHLRPRDWRIRPCAGLAMRSMVQHRVVRICTTLSVVGRLHLLARVVCRSAPWLAPRSSFWDGRAVAVPALLDPFVPYSAALCARLSASGACATGSRGWLLVPASWEAVFIPDTLERFLLMHSRTFRVYGICNWLPLPSCDALYLLDTLDRLLPDCASALAPITAVFTPSSGVIASGMTLSLYTKVFMLGLVAGLYGNTILVASGCALAIPPF